MSNVESSSIACPLIDVVQPRHPHREIAELLAAAIVRIRLKNRPEDASTNSEVCLGFPADQSVHTNPSHQEGFRQ